MKNTTLFRKAIDESFMLMNANIGILEEYRGKRFLFKDLGPYVETVERLKAGESQEEAVYDLHKESVRNHHEILTSLTDSLDWIDEPYTEHIQGPGLMEILYENDPAFRDFTERFMEHLGSKESRSIIAREGARKYTGFYGPSCVADFALTPGSTANVLNQILSTMTLQGDERYYAQTILAAKSWGMNNSYVYAWRYMEALEAGKTCEEAVDGEVEMLRKIYDKPINAEIEFAKELGIFAFGVKDYLERYKKGMRETIEKAMERKVNYCNILAVPALSVGDIGHHLCQSTYDLYADDYTFNMLKTLSQVTEKTVRGSVEDYESLYQILSTATGTAASCITYMLETEGFTSGMLIDLMIKRFQNFTHKYPGRGVGIEFHNVDFLDIIYRGNKIIHERDGKINGMKVDYTPFESNGVTKDFTGKAYPNHEMNRVVSTLLRYADHFCLINIEPVSMAMLTNIIASKPAESMAPVRGCKKCAVSSLLPYRCKYCERTRAI